jgi:hypothetical protein
MRDGSLSSSELSGLCRTIGARSSFSRKVFSDRADGYCPQSRLNQTETTN